MDEIDGGGSQRVRVLIERTKGPVTPMEVRNSPLAKTLVCVFYIDVFLSLLAPEPNG